MAWKNLEDEIAEEFGVLAPNMQSATIAAWLQRDDIRRAKDQERNLFRPKRGTGTRKKRNEAQKRRRRLLAFKERGGQPGKTWKLTDDQKHWAVTNDLGVKPTARLLGVDPRSVRSLRRRAGVPPQG
jgi:hypothetical protein